MQKIWKTKESKKVSQDIINEVGNELLAQLLVQRGIDNIQKIKDFLNPEKMKITSPFVFTDMQKTIERIFSAIEQFPDSDMALCGNLSQSRRY